MNFNKIINQATFQYNLIDQCPYPLGMELLIFDITSILENTIDLATDEILDDFLCA